MIFMLLVPVFLVAAIGAALWLTADARSRLVQEALVRVGVIDLCCGLLTVGFITLHLIAVLGRAGSGRGFGGDALFTYDFRFYSLLLLGIVIIVPGLVCLRLARRLTEGDMSAWTSALWASGALLLINGPLMPLQGFATGLALFAGINLIALWTARRSFT